MRFAIALAIASATISAQPAEGDERFETSVARQASALFDEWLGSPSSPFPASAASDNPDRQWLSRRGDRSADRTVVNAISRAYFPARPDVSPDGWVFEGVRQYVAVRAIHELFAGNHYYSRRFAGGLVPHLVRSVTLTLPAESPQPQVRWFPELAGLPAEPPRYLVTYATSPDAYIVDAMFTLERLVGWPTLQQALAALHARGPQATLSDFTTVLDSVSGRRTAWFMDQVNAKARFDYAIVDLSSAGAAGGGTFETSLKVARLGQGVFPVEIAVRFADGTEVRESWDGRDDELTLRYTSRSAATAALVDPDRTLLLDHDRSNNVIVRDPETHVPAVRWTLQWLTWLEDAMLTYSALL